MQQELKKYIIFDPVMPLLEIVQRKKKKKRKRKSFLYNDIYSDLTYSRKKKPTGNNLNTQQWDNS